MGTPLKTLIVEDNEMDMAMLLRELRRGGYEPNYERVETPEAMAAALDRVPWDIVLSDYSMPRFDAQAALSVLKAKGLDLPFIIVSGTIGEETAVAALRTGAHDFIVKGRLARLLPAIERELREAAMRAERRKISQQLLISERMASVGILAAGVAHEINNPLAVIIANLDFVHQKMDEMVHALHPPGDGAAGGGPTMDWLAARLAEIGEPLHDSQEAAERVRFIARDLRVFARTSDEEKGGPVSVPDVLESAIRMASNEIRYRARLVRDFGDVPPVAANEARLGQVFLNLIVNAAQSMPEGDSGTNEIRIVVRRQGDNHVAVEIRDTGSGIPPEVLPRIFDPFFTTKPAAVGTGLGLAICHRIVSALGGELSVDSSVGSGSVFRVVLPRAREAVAESKPVATQAVPVRRSRILVVDDEPTLCTTIERMLSREHSVTTVTSARQARELIGAGEEYDLILCDLMMPEMTGMDLHAELLLENPQQAEKLIFMTGGAFTPKARMFLDQVPNLSIEKPFTLTMLRQLIGQRLG
jgi:signal transduction histidine kinase